MNRFIWIILVTLIPHAVGGCDRSRLSGPPELRLGRDECADCGMIISEDLCSSALLLDRESTREYAMFDDLGCMLDYLHDKGDQLSVAGMFVHDHGTRAWVEGNAAAYLYCDRERVSTPMGSGILAFSDNARAMAALAQNGGEVHDLSHLMSARRAWLEARFGKPHSEK